MSANDLVRRMRKGEVYRPLRMPSGIWSVVRLDGRNFSRLIEGRYEKPFDIKFHGHMVAAARSLMEEMEGLYAFAQGDEISLLFAREWELNDREIETTVAECAAVASASFTHAAGHPGSFDARIWLGADVSETLDYFRWRQNDASRSCLNAWCLHLLKKDGYTTAEANEEIERKNVAAKNEILFQRGINFNELPVWQRRGVGVVHSEEQKTTTDKRLGASVIVSRRVMLVDRHLPLGEEYAGYLRNVMGV